MGKTMKLLFKLTTLNYVFWLIGFLILFPITLVLLFVCCVFEGIKAFWSELLDIDLCSLLGGCRYEIYKHKKERYGIKRKKK